MSYPEFKAQVNLYVKNRRHALKILIESSGNRPNDCAIKHWENMIHLITFEAKQNKAASNCAMRAFVNAPSHSSHGGKVGAVGRLVSS